MSLYDDFDTIKSRNNDKVAGWSSGIKLLQSQLQLKKAATTQPKRDSLRKSAQLPPVIDLKSKQKEEEEIFSPIVLTLTPQTKQTPVSSNVRDYDWDVVGEYDPLWPNDYEKAVKEIREQRDKEISREERGERTERKRRSRFVDDDNNSEKPMRELIKPPSDEEEEPSTPRRPGGAAIAPPPSLQESSPSPASPASEKPGLNVGGYGGGSIAAKIMAKYGFKEGQGLGKKEQGMSVALQVEKTSKRGGRIIHEKDEKVMPPPPPLIPNADEGASAASMIFPPVPSNNAAATAKLEPTITEIMKSPSKVVLLRNMVGPGDVDEELEPEVKDECNTKYGDVIKVIIYEIPNTVPEEAVRIFVEFKRIESAIKAVVDLNGRFFGGRQVRAGFYSVEKLNTLQLLE